MRSVRKFKRQPSRGRKFAIGMAAALAALIAAVLILPGFIDWSRFKDQIENQASSLTGRQVRITGPIRFRMLPRPALSLENATIANHTGGAEPLMLSLERLDAQFGVLALLSGKIQVANFRMIAPVVNLETLADGANNWDIMGDRQQNPPGIRFDHVTIERGVMRYRNHLRGGTLEAQEMELQLSGESLRGPLSLNGSLRLQNVPMQIGASIGNYAGERDTPLTLKSTLPDGITVDFNGTISPQAELAGSIKSQGADLTLLLASMAQMGVPALSGIQPPLLRHPYQFDGVLAITKDQIKIGKARMTLNENTLTGSLALTTSGTPAFEVLLNAASLDLDKLRQANSAAATPPAPEQDSGPIPAMTGTLRFTGNVVKYNNGVMRDVILAASISGGAMILEEASAHLPGSTTARLGGRMEYDQDQPEFSGKLDMQSENLRALLGWLGLETPGVPERALSRAQVSAQVKVSSGLISLHEVAAEIDSSRLDGDLALALRDRVALGVDLRIDRLNLDNYLPPDAESAAASPAPDSAAESTTDTVAPWPFIRDLIGRYDSNFKLSIDALTYRGVPLTKLQADGSMINGAVTLNGFTIADMAGTAVSLSGVLNNAQAIPDGQIHLRLASNDPGGLAHIFGVTFPVSSAQLGKSTVDAKFQLANSGVEAVIDSRFGETSVQISGGMNALPPSAATSRMRLSVVNPSLRKIAAQAGFDVTPASADEAAGLALSAELTSANGEIILSALNGAIGTIPIQGQANWNSTGPRPVLLLEAHAGDVLMDNLLHGGQPAASAKPGANRQLPWSGAPLDLALLGQLEAQIILDAARFSMGGYDFIKPSLTFELRDGVANLKQFSGQLFGGEARASASLRNTGPVPELAAEWSLKAADMQAAAIAFSGSPAMTGQLDFSGTLKGAGASSFALVSSLEGKAVLAASNGLIQGIDLPAFSARLATLERATDFLTLADTVLQAGSTPYKIIRAPFTVKQGVAQSEQPEISIAAATGGLDVNIDLPRYWLNAEASLTLNEHMDAPPLGLAFIGPLNDPEKSLRFNRLENHFTQALMSKSLQRVINNRQPQIAPPPVSAPPATAAPAPPAQAAPEPAPPAIAPQPDAPQTTAQPDGGKPKNMLNRFLDGIVRDKPR